jgi:hypothetical protein
MAKLSPKQKKIAAQAGDPNTIGGDDFAALRAKKGTKKAAPAKKAQQAAIAIAKKSAKKK